MRRFLTLAAIVAMAVTGAQSASAQTERKVARLGIIDMDRVGSESALGKSYATQIQALQSEIEGARTKKQSDLDKMDTDIKALQDELEKQGALLSEDAAEKKRAEIKKKARDREAFIDDGKAEIEKMLQRAQNQAGALNNELQQKIKPHMEAVAKQQGIDILLDSRTAIALNSEYDISSEVIVKLDEAEKAKGAAAPAKPAASTGAAKPAAPAKPTK